MRSIPEATRRLRKVFFATYCTYMSQLWEGWTYIISPVCRSKATTSIVNSLAANQASYQDNNVDEPLYTISDHTSTLELAVQAMATNSFGFRRSIFNGQKFEYNEIDLRCMTKTLNVLRDWFATHGIPGFSSRSLLDRCSDRPCVRTCYL